MTTPRESAVERTAAKWLREHGWMVVKVQGWGLRSMPDRVAIRHGRHVWFEFKRPKDGRLTKQQQFRHQQLRAHGAEVYVVTSVAEVEEAVKYGS